jgi:hypothetical protein
MTNKYHNTPSKSETDKKEGVTGPMSKTQEGKD